MRKNPSRGAMSSQGYLWDKRISAAFEVLQMLIDASPVGMLNHRQITALSVTHPIVYSRRSKPPPRPLDDAFDSIYLRRTWVVWRRVNGVSGGLWPRNHADTQEML